MDELISTLIYLIPMAFFIFLRMRREQKRQQGVQRATPKKTPASRDLAPSQRRRAEAPRVPAEKAQKKEAPSPQGEASFLMKLFQKGLDPDRTMTRETSPVRPSPPPREKGPTKTARVLVAESPRRVDPVPKASTPGAPDPVSSQAAPVRSSTVTAPASRTGGLPEKLERMSPLRRAVVMAEILGKPRGMEDDPSLLG